MTRRLLPALLVVPLVIALAACGPGTPPDTDPDGSETPVTEPTDEGTDSPAPLDLPDDALLAVTATFTTEFDAQLELLMVVHKSLAWDDLAAADLAALMTTECGGAMDASVYEMRLTSFTLIDVTADDTTGDFPVDAVVYLTPAADFTSVVRTGDVIDDPGADSEAPHCAVDKAMIGQGSGTIVMGLSGDTDAVGAAGNFTKWANHHYGFAIGIDGEFTACDFQVTPLGEEFGWDEPFERVELPSICKFGNFAEDDDR